MRSKTTDLLLSVSFGFILSFLFMVLAPFLGGRYGAQLVAGDPEANRNLPTTLNMMHAAMDGSDPITQNLTSFGWWVTVTILGILLAALSFKILRRYV